MWQSLFHTSATGVKDISDIKTRADANKVRQYRKGILYERFPSEARKKGIKRKETKVEILPSHILFTAYNRFYHGYSVLSMCRLRVWPGGSVTLFCIFVYIF
jgi:hypothetical protein